MVRPMTRASFRKLHSFYSYLEYTSRSSPSAAPAHMYCCSRAQLALRDALPPPNHRNLCPSGHGERGKLGLALEFRSAHPLPTGYTDSDRSHAESTQHAVHSLPCCTKTSRPCHPMTQPSGPMNPIACSRRHPPTTSPCTQVAA